MIVDQKAFNDVITSNTSSPEPQPIALNAPLSSTHVARTRGHRWLSHMSPPPPAVRPQLWFLITDPVPLFVVLSRTLHPPRGAAAECCGLLLCACELAPSLGAQWYHHQLHDFVQL